MIQQTDHNSLEKCGCISTGKAEIKDEYTGFSKAQGLFSNKSVIYELTQDDAVCLPLPANDTQAAPSGIGSAAWKAIMDG